MSKFNVRDKVRYIGEDHKYMPQFYPPVGTIGTVINQSNEWDSVYVHWKKGSTSKEDCWYCDRNDIELVNDIDMTNEEIWEMLRPKMEKNGLISKANLIHVSTDYYPDNEVLITKTYTEEDVINAIATAYRSGYFRAMKGRPFKFGEKKKKGGHWEPINIEDMPKGGYKVVENCLGWEYKYLGIYKQGEDGKFYQWVEDDE